jgi:hypothetical protein
MGRNVGLARAQFADTAGSLLAPERLRLSEIELAEHVREVVREPAPALRPQAAPPPAIGRPAPPARVEQAPPPRALERPVSDWERRRARRFEEDRDRGFPMAGIAAVVGVLLVLGVAGALGAFVVSKLMVAGPGTPVVAVTPSPAIRSTPSAQAQPSPQPSPVATLPTYAPPAQGTIKSVVLALNGDCAAGSNCALEVTLNFTKASAATDYQWTYKAFDPCTGASTDVSTWHFTAQQGWIQIISDHPVKLPAARAQLYVVVVTTSPDQAQSPALTVGQGSC